MELIKLILALAVTLGILVSFHEFGHFIMARIFGIKVIRFSIGFGKVIWSRFDKKGTEFAVSIIPLGGYVSMLDDALAQSENRQITAEEKDQLFSSKAVWKRFLVIGAGPAFNFLLALAAFWLLFYLPYYQLYPLVGKVSENSIAHKADIRHKDKIISIESKEVNSWQEVFLQLTTFAGENRSINIEVERDNKRIVKKLAVENFMNADEKNPLKFLGLVEYLPPHLPIIDKILPNSPAFVAGLQSNDKILQINEAVITDWSQVVDLVKTNPNKELTFLVKRNFTNLVLIIKPDTVKNPSGALIGRIGASVKAEVSKNYEQEYWRKIDNSVLDALGLATMRTWNMSIITLESVGKIIKGVLAPDNISGPISIAKMAYNSANLGWKSFLQFLAVVSISLGVLNILPIPMLDGGQLVFLMFEAMGIKLSTKLKVQVNMIGFVLLMTIMFMAIYFDILRL